MGETRIEKPDAAKRLQKALARWDNEGGAGPDGPQKQDTPAFPDDLPHQSDAELVLQLHVRIIALENLVFALLAGASDWQRTFARDMAASISPRPGSMQHPLTVQAARQMLGTVERAELVGRKSAD